MKVPNEEYPTLTNFIDNFNKRQIPMGQYLLNRKEYIQRIYYEVFKEGNGFTIFLRKGGHIMNKQDIIEHTTQSGMNTISFTESLTYSNKQTFGEENLHNLGYQIGKDLGTKQTYVNCSRKTVIEVNNIGNGLTVTITYLEGKDNIYLMHCN